MTPARCEACGWYGIAKLDDLGFWTPVLDVALALGGHAPRNRCACGRGERRACRGELEVIEAYRAEVGRALGDGYSVVVAYDYRAHRLRFEVRPGDLDAIGTLEVSAREAEDITTADLGMIVLGCRARAERARAELVA